LLEKVRTSTPGLPTQFRIKAEAGKEHLQDGTRTLTGRILDQDGEPIAGVQINYNDRKSPSLVTIATDRLGVFHMGGLPTDRFMIDMSKKGYNGATAIVPPEALEIEVTLPRKSVASE
jgi:Carboxypeptidase regulatory-like domain